MKTYLKTNPRSVRGAKRRGWHVVTLPKNWYDKHSTSWLGISMWADKHSKSYYVSSYSNLQFAFERMEDASWFTMKWCI